MALDYSGLFGGVGDVASTLISAGFGAMNSKRQYHWTRNLMNLQNELQRDNNIWSMQNAPQLTRQGLEAAGYNPILAISSGFGNSSNASGLGSAPAGNMPESNIGGSSSNAYQAFKLAREKNTAEVNATNASASLASEQAKTEEFKRMQLQSQTFLNNIDHQLRSKDLSWYDRRALMDVKTGYINAQANALSSRASMSHAYTAKMVGESNRDYNNSMRDLNVLNYHIKSPKAWASLERPRFINSGFSNWNYAVKSISGRN